jgi:hypothetical protein
MLKIAQKCFGKWGENGLREEKLLPSTAGLENGQMDIMALDVLFYPSFSFPLFLAVAHFCVASIKVLERRILSS